MLWLYVSFPGAQGAFGGNREQNMGDAYRRGGASAGVSAVPAEGVAAAAEHRPDAGQLDPCLPGGGWVKIILAALDAHSRLQASARVSDSSTALWNNVGFHAGAWARTR